MICDNTTLGFDIGLEMLATLDPENVTSEKDLAADFGFRKQNDMMRVLRMAAEKHGIKINTLNREGYTRGIKVDRRSRERLSEAAEKYWERVQ